MAAWKAAKRDFFCSEGIICQSWPQWSFSTNPPPFFPHPLSPVCIWGGDSFGHCEILCRAVTCSPLYVSLLAGSSVAVGVEGCLTLFYLRRPPALCLCAPSRVTLLPIQETNHPQWFTGFHYQLQKKTDRQQGELSNPSGSGWHHTHLYVHTHKHTHTKEHMLPGTHLCVMFSALAWICHFHIK